MNCRLVIQAAIVFLSFVYVAGTGFRALPDAQYDIIVRLLRQEFHVPVKERTNIQKSAIVKFWRNKYTLGEDGKTIMLNGQLVVRTSQTKALVRKEMHATKGSGSRKLYKRLANKVVGFSEKVVKSVSESSAIYSNLNAKFSNKAPLRPVSAKEINDIHQIDPIDLSKLNASVDGKYFRYALTVVDVFSRFLWLVALERKNSKSVAMALRSIYLVHGTPKILQSDNGKEFQGAVQRLMRSMYVKIIRSSPYHPQSQGKVERCHRSLRKKIVYDLLKHGKRGVNWVVQLPLYNQVLNDQPKEELAWKSPFQVYFGRKSNCASIPWSLTDVPAFVPSERLRPPKTKHREEIDILRGSIRKSANKATLRLNKRVVERGKRSNPPMVYKVNDKVLVRLTKSKNARLSSARIVQASIVKTKQRLARYKVRFVNYEEKDETKWVPVNDITSCTITKERRKKEESQTSKYLFELTHADRLSQIHDQGFDIAYDPQGDGSCQFAALADQLVSLGIYRSADTLRKEVVRDMRSRPYSSNGTDITDFVDDNDLQVDLDRMELSNTYGDHITLLHISEIFNCRILVVSSLGPDHQQVIGVGGLLLTVGYFPEGHGGQYVSLRPMAAERTQDEDVLPNDQSEHGEDYVSLGPMAAERSNQVESTQDEDFLPNDQIVHGEDYVSLGPMAADRSNQVESTQDEDVLPNDQSVHGEDYVSLGPMTAERSNQVESTQDEDVLPNDQSEHFFKNNTMINNPIDSGCSRQIFFLDLPNEILAKIVAHILDDDLDMAATLRETHPILGGLSNDYLRLYPDRVRRYNRKVYINHGVLLALSPGADGSVVTTIRMLSKQCGRYSGLMTSFREHLYEYRNWRNASVVLLPISLGWYRIKYVFWK